jgi:hypothetical protein
MYRVRLAPGKLGFYCPKTNLHLHYPQKIEGEVPANADLTNIKRAVKSGRLLEVPVAAPAERVAEVPEAPLAEEDVQVKEQAAEPEEDTVPPVEKGTARNKTAKRGHA